MGQGILKVDVRTADNALPVEGADVTVSEVGGRRLYRLKANADGQTEPVSLPAPDSSTTMRPGGAAYATYTVAVAKDGYVTETVVGAEILDGISHTQPVFLRPVTADGNGSETVVVPDSALKQDPPTGQQPRPARLSARTLGDVIIPQKITVHLGTPQNAYAKNISVSFPYYVKNVAASEIYATWPQPSLEANIFAIISLALNRVYTEWYRSQGYPFDITNSTKTDQYFKEGQTIPDNISQIADRIFNRYIRRIGHKEPLFSSYCDGSTVTCPGMSQWGTVNLANSGYTAMNILRYYFGNNIEIAQTDRIGGVLTSFPGGTLSQGSEGASVKVMQTYLNRIAANFPQIPQGEPDGIYGPKTAAAVRAFQRINNLPQNGVIDAATWNRINYIYLAVTKLAELGSEGQRIGIGAEPPKAVVSQGSKGANVVQVQFLLKAIGAFYNTVPQVIEDGTYGPATASAVRAFQRQFGLNADGVVGPATWRKLYSVYQSLNIKQPEDGTPGYPGTPLKAGSKGSDVELVQTLLNAVSAEYPSIPRVIVDGVYGPTTKAQATEFQRLFGLTTDGVVGPATWNALMNAYYYNESGVISPPVSAPPAYPGYSLRQGSVGEGVRVLQAYLNRAPFGAGLREDGIFGPATKAAVVAAQTKLGLVPDGIAGPKTWGGIVG